MNELFHHVLSEIIIVIFGPGTLWNTANHPRKSFDIQPLLSNVPTFSFMYRLSHSINGTFDLWIVVLYFSLKLYMQFVFP